MFYSGGNQREKSREKAAKKQKETERKKGQGETGANKGLTLEERRHRFVALLFIHLQETTIFKQTTKLESSMYYCFIIHKNTPKLFTTV